MIIFLLMGYLLVCSIVDLKDKKIPVYLLCIGICFGLVYSIFQLCIEEKQINDLMLSLMPSILLILLCKISKESIGIADGIMFMITGLIIDSYGNLLLIIISFFSSFIVSCILIMIKKVNKSVRIPFVPFILFSVIILRCIEK